MRPKCGANKIHKFSDISVQGSDQNFFKNRIVGSELRSVVVGHSVFTALLSFLDFFICTGKFLPLRRTRTVD
jgi:hypothetical protein